MENYNRQKSTLRAGCRLSVLLAVLTLVTFGLAMIAVPPVGPYCVENCMEYPFLGSLDFYPRDFYWIYLAMVQLIIFIGFLGVMYLFAPGEKKVFGISGMLLGMAAATILIMTYFVQAYVVPVSLMKGETEGLALLTMYNENGIFIAREEIGYILMSLSLVAFSFMFKWSERREKILRVLFLLPFAGSVVAFVVITFQYGLERSYRFEVATISANWLILIIAGFVLAGLFKSELKNLNN